MKKSIFFTLFLCFSWFHNSAQEIFKANQLNIFLDCTSCNYTYIRQELPQLNYVRRLEHTDVQIRSTKLENGSGGFRHNLIFIGHNRFQNHDQELFFIENQDMSFDEVRKGIFKVLKAGLVPYISHISSKNEIEISLPESLYSEDWNATQWKNWKLVAGGNISHNSSTNSTKRWELDPYISINQATPEKKFGLQYYLFYDKNKQPNGSESSTQSHRLNGYYSKALSPKWSTGISVLGHLSKNKDQVNKSLFVRPMIEYSVFPYEVFHKKQLTLRYSTTFTEDKRFESHGPRVQLTLFKKWGFISTIYNVQHNLRKNRIDILSTQLFANIWVRLSKGIYLSFDAQILGSIQLSTETSPFSSRRMGVSFNYLLGDIYNNVLNPRLGF